MASAPPPHPYFPQGSIIPNFIPNDLPVISLLTRFAGLLAVHLTATYLLARHTNPSLSRSGHLTTLWFSLCAALHLTFESHFTLNHASIPSSQSLFSQLWKEYALSDSRYITSDPFMLCIETLTVIIWGPLCALAAVLVVKKKRNQVMRDLVTVVVSVGHLYGVLLYYGTCWNMERLSGVEYSRPEGWYYWGYYVGMNLPWVVVPGVLIWQSVGRLARVGSLLEGLTETEGKGMAKMVSVKV